MYCGCCAGSIGGKQIGDFLAILGGVAPQNRAENLDSFIPMDIVGAQRNGDTLGFEQLQNCTRILTLSRRKVSVVLCAEKSYAENLLEQTLLRDCSPEISA